MVAGPWHVLACALFRWKCEILRDGEALHNSMFFHAFCADPWQPWQNIFWQSPDLAKENEIIHFTLGGYPSGLNP